MPQFARVDRELVRRKQARSREDAQQLIKSGKVMCNGMPVTKPATMISTADPLSVAASDEQEWASRGAHKLCGALEAFAPYGLSVDGQRCLDAGASTGGFTDVLLENGAKEVCAVDVGYGQLIWRLYNDPRVHVYDRTNIRTITPETIGGDVDIVVSDLSFISLTLVLPALRQCCRPGAQMMLMIKPQFEVGKERLGKGGVVRRREDRIFAIVKVAEAALEQGLCIRGITASPLPGPSGNVEYFLWLENPSSPQETVGSITEMPLSIIGVSPNSLDIVRAVSATVVDKGPQ